MIIRKFRLPFLFLAMIGLLAGLITGLNRIGWNLGLPAQSLHHGAIMIGGFLGTLISLEKIIPLKKKVLFIIPALSGISVVVFFAGRANIAFQILTLASIGLCAVFLHYLLRERNQIYLLMLTGSMCWLIGNVVLVMNGFYPPAFQWWLGFVLFIITSERLELMKFLPVTSRQKLQLIILLFFYLAGVLFSFHAGGNWVSGLALVFIAMWLMHHDLVLISMRKTALPKFVAIALFCGYVAMLMTGIFFIALGRTAMSYDAIVHTFFLGFVFSMIFAHGPIILPGILGISAKPYHPILYVWLCILHLSWITRIAADILLEFQLRMLSGIASGFSILAFFATMAILTVRTQRHATIL